jgi:hypothetical protein
MAKLEDYLATRPHKGFEATRHYSDDGDCLTLYFENVPSYRDRVDELLTLYLSLETDDLVGFQIESIGRIMKRLRNLRILIKDKDVELRVLFLACRALAEDPGPLKTYERLLDAAKRRKAILPSKLTPARKKSMQLLKNPA